MMTNRIISFFLIFVLAFCMCSCSKKNNTPMPVTTPEQHKSPKGDTPEDDPAEDDPPEEEPEVIEYIPSDPIDEGVFHISFIQPPMSPTFHAPSIDQGIMVCTPAQMQWEPMEDYNLVCSMDGSFKSEVRNDIYDPVIKNGKLYYFKGGGIPDKTFWIYDIKSGKEKKIYEVDSEHASLGMLSCRGDHITWHEGKDQTLLPPGDDSEVVRAEDGSIIAIQFTSVIYNIKTGKIIRTPNCAPSPYYSPFVFKSAYASTIKDGDKYVTSIISFRNGKTEFKFTTCVPPCSLDYDGRYCAYGLPDYGFGVYEVKSGRRVINFEGAKDWTQVMLADDILVYGRGYSLYAIDLNTKQRIFDIKQFDSGSNDYFFSPRIDESDGTILFERINHDGGKKDEICVMTIGE